MINTARNRARQAQAAAELERRWWEWENWHFQTYGWVPQRPPKPEPGLLSMKQASWLDVWMASW